MSSPNEPGYPRAGEGPGGANGSPANHDAGPLGAPRPGVADGGEVPPWQRGPMARAAQGPPRPPEAAQRRGPGPRGDGGREDAHAPERPSDDAARGNANHPPNVDSRLNRFMSGSGSAPTEEVAGRGGERTDAARPEAYASELPDLSGPTPRPPQQRKPAERPVVEPANRPAAANRVQVGTRNKGPVRASMQIRRIDPWSTLKVSLVLSVALFFVWMIAVAFLYLVLGGMGVWSKLNSNVGDLLTSASGTSGGELVSSGTIFGGAALIGLVNIVLLTAMATVGAFIYNLTTDLVGGVEVTLADRD
ncbi:MAG TPA: DUF3566 domain-containing protein [Mycobacterium sp.]|nr:DUF3566 domain-containing protein [Mycobacterium sp.]